MTKWIRTKTAMPSNNERVLAKYEGVYDARIVTFWRDGGGRPHFGLPSEADGKGSQPATHWAKFDRVARQTPPFMVGKDSADSNAVVKSDCL